MRLRRGDCWDNTVSESLFGTLRTELVDDERHPTRRAAERSIGDYVERSYDVELLRSHFGYFTSRMRASDLHATLAELRACVNAADRGGPGLDAAGIGLG